MTPIPLLLTLLAAAPAAAADPASAPPAVTAPAPASPSDPAGSAPALTLEDAFRRALAANPTVQAAQSAVAAAEARRRQAFSLVLPQISLTGAVKKNSQEVSFGSGDDSRVILPGQDWNARLNLRQPLFAGLREKRAYDQSKLAVGRAGEGLRDLQNRLLLAVGTDYLETVAADALVAVERRNLELASARAKQAQDFFDVGETTKLDLLRATTSIKDAERALVEAQAQRQRREGSLRVSLALDSPADGAAAPLAVAPPEQVLPPLPAAAELEARALAAPEVRDAELALEIAELEVKKQLGAYLPVAYIDGGWLQQKSAFPSDDYGYVALNLEVPIFQGGQVSARVAEARSTRDQRAAELDDLRRATRENLRTALTSLDSARTVVTLAHEEQAAADEAYRQAFELYRAQESSALDLEAAEASLADARRRSIAAELAEREVELEIWYLTGGLRDVVASPSEEPNR